MSEYQRGSASGARPRAVSPTQQAPVIASKSGDGRFASWAPGVRFAASADRGDPSGGSVDGTTSRLRPAGGPGGSVERLVAGALTLRHVALSTANRCSGDAALRTASSISGERRPPLRLTALALIVSILPGCASESEAPQPTVAQFQTVVDDWAAAVTSGNATAVADLFTADGILVFSDGRPPQVGRDAIRAYCTDLFNRMTVSVTMSQPASEVHNQWGQALTDYRATWTQKSDGSTSPENQRFFWTMRRQPDGTWLIAVMTGYPI